MVALVEEDEVEEEEVEGDELRMNLTMEIRMSLLCPTMGLP